MANITIQDIRQKYPQYDHISDQELADKLHTKFYSQLPKEDFYSKIGLSGQTTNAPSSKDEKIKQLMGQTEAPGEQFGAGIAQGLSNIGPGIANLGIHAYNGITGNNVQPFQSANFAPNTFASKAGELGSMAIGPNALGVASKIGPIANALEKIGAYAPRAANVFGNTAKGISQGAVYNPENQTAGAVAGGTLGGFGSAILPTFAKALNKVTPKAVASTVQAAHDKLKNYSSDLFNLVKGEAKERGVNTVPMGHELIEEAKQYLPNTRASKNLLEKAKSGNYEDVQKLQSDLWERGTKKKSSDLAADRDAGEEMLDTRDKINESVANHFNESGHPDLAKTLNEARNKWHELKETYYKHPTIAKLVHEETRKVPENIGSVLNEDSIPMERVRQANPLIAENLEKLNNKNKALTRLKWTGGTIGALGGLGALTNSPALYHAARNVFSE